MISVDRIIPQAKRSTRKLLHMNPPRDQIPIVQIELSGICNAGCEHCDIVRRPKSQQVYMETALAKKAVKEAKEMKADHISFHVTGESLTHPDLFDILPCDCEIGLSTNCLALIGQRAERLARMENMRIILAVLWTSEDKIRERSLRNALDYLQSEPKNQNISLQMVTSTRAEPYAKLMYFIGEEYFDRLPQLKLMYKQPYTQEVEYPTLGFIPDVPEAERREGSHRDH